MTSWNHRILVEPDGDDGKHMTFVECYYDDQGGVIGWCPHGVSGESLYDLLGQLQRLLFVVTEAIVLEQSHLTSTAGRGVVAVEDLPTADEPQEIAERFADEEVEPVRYRKNTDETGGVS